MEPKMSAPNPSQETGAYNPQLLPPRTPEVQYQVPVEASPDKPAPQEQQPVGPVQDTSMLPVPAPQAQQMSGQPARTLPILNPVPTTDTNPVAAADEEVIEKEWVDKAKKIITQTKNDPYMQEKEVSKLQADYLKKRYGKEVKLTND